MITDRTTDLPSDINRYWTTEEIAKIIGLATIAVTASSMMFVVGYYYGIHESLMTLFNLGEHLSFAWQASPLALVFVAGVGFITAGGGFLLRYLLAHKLNAGMPRTRAMEEIGWLIAAISILSGAACLSLYSLLDEPMFIVLFLYFCSFLAWGLWACREPLEFYAVPVIALLLLGATLTLAFILGVMKSKDDIKNEPYARDIIETTEVNYLHARVVNASANGILFLDAEHQNAVYLPWRAIKAVKTYSRGGKNIKSFLTSK